jgi:hypothetical protein
MMQVRVAVERDAQGVCGRAVGTGGEVTANTKRISGWSAAHPLIRYASAGGGLERPVRFLETSQVWRSVNPAADANPRQPNDGGQSRSRDG